MMMQAFPSPPPPAVVACRCCCKLEIAHYNLPSLGYQNQGSGIFQVDFCDVQRGGQNIIGRMRREARKGRSQGWSGADNKKNPMTGDTMTTTAVPNSGMDCHDLQEERVSTSSMFRSSILDCNSSSAAADVLRNDLNGLRCNDVNAGTTTFFTRSQKCDRTSSSASPLEIDCFNEADISAACLLLEMSSHSRDDAATEEESSQKQPCSIVRVSDYDDHNCAAAPSLPPIRELSEQMGAERRSAGCRTATDDDDIGGTVQERKAIRVGEANYSSSSSSTTPSSLRIEFRTLGKKRIRHRKDERELVFRMNQEVSDSKLDILDRPTRKRNYKSLRELLGVNS